MRVGVGDSKYSIIMWMYLENYKNYKIILCETIFFQDTWPSYSIIIIVNPIIVIVKPNNKSR